MLKLLECEWPHFTKSKMEIQTPEEVANLDDSCSVDEPVPIFAAVMSESEILEGLESSDEVVLTGIVKEVWKRVVNFGTKPLCFFCIRERIQSPDESYKPRMCCKKEPILPFSIINAILRNLIKLLGSETSEMSFETYNILLHIINEDNKKIQATLIRKFIPLLRTQNISALRFILLLFRQILKGNNAQIKITITASQLRKYFLPLLEHSRKNIVHLAVLIIGSIVSDRINQFRRVLNVEILSVLVKTMRTNPVEKPVVKHVFNYWPELILMTSTTSEVLEGLNDPDERVFLKSVQAMWAIVVQYEVRREGVFCKITYDHNHCEECPANLKLSQNEYLGSLFNITKFIGLLKSTNQKVIEEAVYILAIIVKYSYPNMKRIVLGLDIMSSFMDLIVPKTRFFVLCNILEFINCMFINSSAEMPSEIIERILPVIDQLFNHKKIDIIEATCRTVSKLMEFYFQHYHHRTTDLSKAIAEIILSHRDVLFNPRNEVPFELMGNAIWLLSRGDKEVLEYVRQSGLLPKLLAVRSRDRDVNATCARLVTLLEETD